MRHGGGGRSCQTIHQDNELVAAEPRREVALANLGVQPRGEGTQQLVPHGVAVTVVHRLEVVEVDVEHGEGVAIALAHVQAPLELVEKRAAADAGSGQQAERDGGGAGGAMSQATQRSRVACSVCFGMLATATHQVAGKRL